MFEQTFDNVDGVGSWVSAAEARERISAALDAIDAAHDVLRDTPSDLVGSDFRVDVAARLETQERTNRGLMYRMFAEIADPPDETGFVSGGTGQAVGAPADHSRGNHAPFQTGGPDSPAAVADRSAIARGAACVGRSGGGR